MNDPERSLTWSESRVDLKLQAFFIPLKEWREFTKQPLTLTPARAPLKPTTTAPEPHDLIPLQQIQAPRRPWLSPHQAKPSTRPSIPNWPLHHRASTSCGQTSPTWVRQPRIQPTRSQFSLSPPRVSMAATRNPHEQLRPTSTVGPKALTPLLRSLVQAKSRRGVIEQRKKGERKRKNKVIYVLFYFSVHFLFRKKFPHLQCRRAYTFIKWKYIILV